MRKKGSFHKRIEHIKQAFGQPEDLIFHIVEKGSVSLAIIYFKSLVEQVELKRGVVKKIQASSEDDYFLDEYMNIVTTPASLKESSDELLNDLLEGMAVIILSNSNAYVICDVSSTEGRDIVPSETEINIRGPHEAFTERLDKNIGLLRMRIRNPNLRLVSLQLGNVTKTKVIVSYIEGTAPKEIIDEVFTRLNQVDINIILESQMIEEAIVDKQASLFPTISNTELPAKVASRLIEGRVAILTEGTPFALTVPALFTEFFQAPEDYYQRWDIASLLRLLRFTTFIWGTLVPGLFVALTTYHQEMIPSLLLYSFAAQREGLPYPSLVEVLIMEFIFEVLREAGVRMPVAIGSAISIVGALVLGQAAVQAGLISAAVVIVVSLTAVANFVSPAYNFGVTGRILRFGFLLAGGTLGFYGMFFLFLVVLIHSASLQSFGVSYLTPFAPLNLRDLRDTFVRLPDNWVKNQIPKGIGRKE
ncbi:spore germination protein [Guptibacillus algicola]|uniref:spore germination protein n=1 Tax=Guptibacillus algicola TaxID=225844 RepID=UPI001CD4405E|nr:spore germination protein [Alkalihalobacillus algicola]MCA0987614.1 spore germination protein [Alkalihalobacillus algicola]